jgi:hypothetical protein
MVVTTGYAYNNQRKDGREIRKPANMTDHTAQARWSDGIAA